MLLEEAVAAGQANFPPSVYFGYLDADSLEPRSPQPKQAIAHQSLAEELFYGGAAGGGKSEFAIVDAVKTCIQHPRIQVAVFRRTLKELEQSLIGRFRELVDPRIAKYVGGDQNQGKFRNGSTLWFCYCANERDVYRYQSAQWAALYLDEGTHFTEFQFTYLSGRVRVVRTNVRKKIRVGANPGGVGHLWAKKRWIKPGGYELADRPTPAPFEIWRPLPPPEKPWVKQRTRQFIPAKLSDNPALQEADPNYISSLYMQHGALAAQLAEGDWDSYDGMILSEWQDTRTVKAGVDDLLIELGVPEGATIPWHRVDKPHWRPPRSAKIFGSVDYGFGAPWSFHLHATLVGGHVRTFFEFYKTGVRDHDQARMIRGALERLTCDDGSPLPKPEWIVLDPAMDNSRQEHGISKSIMEVYQDELGIPLNVLLVKGAAGRGARVSRPQRWKEALSTAPDGLPWWTYTTACPHLGSTVPAVPWDPDDKEVEDDDSENHAYEDTGRFFEARPRFPVAPRADVYEHLDTLSRQHAEALDRKLKPGRAKGIGALGRLS